MAAKKPKKEEKEKKEMFMSGKRKRAIARAVIRPGKGIIKINSRPLGLFSTGSARMLIGEPLALAGEGWKNYNITVNVKGGGVMGQAEASRLAIAKGLAGLLGDDVRKKFQEYDKNLLVADPRRTEPHKPPRSSQGPRRHKQRSKR
jgi:small subunit ribosomal protein S9